MYHKNSQKRIYLDNAVYFVTTKTKYGYPFFKNPILANLFIRRLLIAKKQKEFKLFGYVIIPDHVHLLIRPYGKYNISQIIFTTKKQFSHEANRLIGLNPRTPASAGEQALVRLRKYVITHNLNIIRFRWQKSFHDHIIRNENDFNTYIEYLRYNPIKHGLVKKNEPYPYLYVNGAGIENL